MNFSRIIRLFDEVIRSQDEEIDLFPEHRSIVCISMLPDYSASTIPESPDRGDCSSHPERDIGGYHTRGSLTITEDNQHTHS